MTPSQTNQPMNNEAKETPLTFEQIEQLCGRPSYSDWELLEMCAGEGTVQYKIRFSIPLEEEDWLYNYLLKEPSRLIPLYEFVHHARTAFNDIVCYDEYSDPAEFDVQGLTPYDWYSWAIRAVGDDVEEALQQMIDDEGELPEPIGDEDEDDMPEPIGDEKEDDVPEPIEKHVDKTKHADTAAAFKYIILQHYPKVHNPMPDCMTDDVRMPENRFLRTLAQLWGSINPWNTKQQRFTYWIYYRYEHHF